MNNLQQQSTVTPEVSSLAVMSLVFSCLSIFLGPLGFLPGIICGHLARRNIQKNPGLTGKGIAVAGMVTGYVFLVLITVATILVWLMDAIPVQPS